MIPLNSHSSKSARSAASLSFYPNFLFKNIELMAKSAKSDALCAHNAIEIIKAHGRVKRLFRADLLCPPRKYAQSAALKSPAKNLVSVGGGWTVCSITARNAESLSMRNGSEKTGRCAMRMGFNGDAVIPTELMQSQTGGARVLLGVATQPPNGANFAPSTITVVLPVVQKAR